MIPLRKEKGIAAAAIGIISSAILAPDAAAGDRVAWQSEPQPSASNSVACYTPPPYYPALNCYGIAGTDQFIADGAAARFDVKDYTAPDFNKGGHTNHTLWMGLQSSPSYDKGKGWVEIGWTKGITADGQVNGTRVHYWAWGDDDAPYPEPTYDNGIIGPTGPSGTSNHYQIARIYDGLYRGYIDFQEAVNFYFAPATLWTDVGLEYTHPNAAAPLQWVRNLQWRCCNLVWHNWGDLGTYVNDGISESNDGRAHWQWVNKPVDGADWIQQ